MDTDRLVAPSQGETDGQTLERLRDNAGLWAAEFRKTALRLGYSDMDEGWLIGWFANAIENSWDVRSGRSPKVLPDGSAFFVGTVKP